MTPATVHYDQVDEVCQQRQKVLNAAYRAHPERFVGGRPTPPQLPDEVWINPPEREHRIIGFADPAAKASLPGVQAGSRAKNGAFLDANVHRAALEKPVDQPEIIELFYSKLQYELSQSA